MPTARDLLDDLGAYGLRSEELPECTDSENGNLLIIGAARCVWDDLRHIRFQSYDIMCINDIGMHLPLRVKHWFSNHGDCLPYWRTCREFHYGRMIENDAPKLHSCFSGRLDWPSDKMSEVVRWPWPGHASSGLNACYTGLALGYKQIVLAGVPYDNRGHYFDADADHQVWRGRPSWVNFDIEGFRQLWRNVNDRAFKGRVKSLSGITRDILGAP